MVVENEQSVIDAVIALKRLGALPCIHADEIGRANEENGDAAKAKTGGSDPVVSSCEELKSSSLYWLNVNTEDFRGLTFPQKMHHVLRNEEELADIISWLPSGRSFVIRDAKKFTSEVIPKFFGKQRIAYTSFTRRLLRWGWQHITKGTYSHVNFHRDHPERCLLMTYDNHVSSTTNDVATLESDKKPTPSNMEPVTNKSFSGDTPYSDGADLPLRLPLSFDSSFHPSTVAVSDPMHNDCSKSCQQASGEGNRQEPLPSHLAKRQRLVAKCMAIAAAEIKEILRVPRCQDLFLADPPIFNSYPQSHAFPGKQEVIVACNEKKQHETVVQLCEKIGEEAQINVIA